MIIILFITKAATGPGGSVLGGIGPGGGAGRLPLGAGGKSELQEHVFCFSEVLLQTNTVILKRCHFLNISIDYGTGGFGILPTGGMPLYSLQYKLNTA